MWARRNVSCATSAVARAIPPGCVHIRTSAQDVDEVGTEPPIDAHSDLFDLDWGDDPTASINSVTGRSDRARRGNVLPAFVDSGEVDNVLPQMVCAAYPVETTTKSRSGVGFKGANGSHIEHCGQRRFRVKTSTPWKVADVRKPLISASRLLERGQKLVLDEKPRIQCKNGDTIALERCGRLFAVRCGLLMVFPSRAERRSQHEKKICETAH